MQWFIKRFKSNHLRLEFPPYALENCFGYIQTHANFLASWPQPISECSTKNHFEALLEPLLLAASYKEVNQGVDATVNGGENNSDVVLLAEQR